MIRQNIKSLILLTIFSVSVSSNLLSIKNDPTSLTQVTKSLYSEEKWEYLEKLFIKELDSVYSKTETRVNMFARAVFFVPVTLMYFASEAEKELPFPLAMVIGSVGGFLNTGITGGFWTMIFKKKINKEKIATMFDLFFQKYNPEIDEDSDEFNSKEVVPAELYKTFDLMYADYLLNGKESLNKSCSDIYDFIIEKIEIDVKSDKYDRIWKRENSREKRRNERIHNAVNVTRK